MVYNKHMNNSFARLIDVAKGAEIVPFANSTERVVCPFCATVYSSRFEIRTEVTCRACDGHGITASELEAIAVAELEAAITSGDLRRLQRVAKTLPNTYYSFQAQVMALQMSLSEQ